MSASESLPGRACPRDLIHVVQAAAMTHGSASERRRVQATGKVGRPSACGAMRSIAAFLGGGVRFDPQEGQSETR